MGAMDDVELVHRINELVEEEHALERSHIGESPTEEQVHRLRNIEVALDQCWDLLRQRRSRRAAGQDPETASLRPVEIVEDYQQ
jgi:hypothetical protein